MSLFVAVRPSDEAVDDLDHAVTRARRAVDAPGVRWQPPGHWHLTLAFLGDPDDHIADEVSARLDVLSGSDAVPGTRLRGAGTFGGQVLWIGLEPGPAHDRLADLAKALPPLLRGSGATADWRPWRAHLTLARARRGSFGRLPDLLDGYVGPEWDVNSLDLIRSTGGPRPAHQVLARIPLSRVPPRSPA